VERRRTALAEHSLQSTTVRDRLQRLELAVFAVGPARYALPASMVLQALPKAGIVRMPSQNPAVLGLQEVLTDTGPALVRVVCARELFGVRYTPRESDGVVVVLSSPATPMRPALGIQVDDVMGITEVSKAIWQASPMQGASAPSGPRILGLVDCPLVDLAASKDGRAGARALVQVLDIHSVLASVLPGGCSSAAPVGNGLEALESVARLEA
jgi:chemotaxis signal transduction protein